MHNTQTLTEWRNATPACHHKIHLNNAGSSLPPRLVTEAVLRYLETEANLGGYEMAAAQAAEIEGFYTAVARLLNAQPRNIAWQPSATDGYNKALSAIPFQPGDSILTTDDDYVSNQIAFLFLQKRLNVNILRAKKLSEGGVDVQSMQELMDRHRPKLVAVTHVPTNSGLVQDVEAVGKLCRERGLWYLVDACQSAGQIPLDVAAIGCDFLSATFRKWLRGPRGAGFLFASDRVTEAGLEPFFPDLGGGTVWTQANEYQLSPDARRFEYWEKPFALLVGSKTAVEYALEIGIERIEQRVTDLAAHARARLATLPGVRVLDRGRQLCGIVTLQVEGKQPADLKPLLEAANINAGFAQRMNSVIDFDEKGVEWALRVSPHYYNTHQEIDRLLEVM